MPALFQRLVNLIVAGTVERTPEKYRFWVWSLFAVATLSVLVWATKTNQDTVRDVTIAFGAYLVGLYTHKDGTPDVE